MTDAAIKVAEQWPIFPCNPLDKKPIIPKHEGGNGFKDATTDKATIRRWWNKYPNAMVGVPTGEASGFWVLDLDVADNKNGIHTWDEIAHKHPPIFTRGHHTPRGGRHLLFKWDPKHPVASKTDVLGKGIDTRGNGGYVIVPPSRNAEGKEYTSTTADIVDAPDWLYEMIENAGRRERKEEHTVNKFPTDEQLLIRKFRFVLDIITDDSYDTWKEIGGALQKTLGEKGYKLFKEWSEKSKKFNAADCIKKWKDFGDLSKYNAGTIFHHADKADPSWRDRWRQQEFRASFLTERQFLEQYVPPDYLIDGILQRGFLYCLTGPTGSGKTCVVLLLAMLMLMGHALDNKEVEKGKVLYFAGENPQDVLVRWMRLREVIHAPEDLPIHWLWGAHNIGDAVIRKEIDEYAKLYGPFDMIIIDTSAAYGRYNDENDNVQMLAHAKMLRSFVSLPGRPVVLATTHPIKHHQNLIENMKPRGGGAFLNEIDGNLTLMHDHAQMTSEMTADTEKWRGPEFGSITFKLVAGQSESLRDKKNRPLYTIAAHVMSAEEQSRVEKVREQRENELLLLCHDWPSMSLADYAKRLNWTFASGAPNKMLVERTFKNLKADKLADKRRGRWQLTKAGQAEAKTLSGVAKASKKNAEQGDLI